MSELTASDKPARSERGQPCPRATGEQGRRIRADEFVCPNSPAIRCLESASVAGQRRLQTHPADKNVRTPAAVGFAVASARLLAFSFLLCLLSVVLPGCTTKHYRKSADREAAKIIAEKTPTVPNMDTKFTIEQEKLPPLDDLPVNNKAEDSLGAEAQVEVGAHILSLEKALDLAVKHSRDYQNRKELLYLEALNLALQRYRFTPIFSAGASGKVNRDTVTVNLTNGIDKLVEQKSVNGQVNAGVDVLLRTGGRIATDLTIDFFRFIKGDPRFMTSSRLLTTFSQPLLQGGGYKVAMENLTQAERNLLYALRDFAQFRKEFSVDVASRYYGVLQARDTVRNNWLGFQNFKQNVARMQAFVDEEKKPEAELGRLKQAELQTELGWVNAVRGYKRSLDEFKILLGLSTDAKVVLDDADLEKLKIVHPDIKLDDALRVALATRLDLYTVKDRYADAERKIKIASNGLLPKLDLLASIEVDSKAGNAPFDMDWKRYQWNAGLDLDLPLDRKAERNAYRAALISYERAGRELELAIDRVKQDVYEGWRSLDQARRNYAISEVGVKLSERRVEEQELRTELGLGEAKDLVDARTDLINARNDRTQALVGHIIARLQFWRDLGILTIRDNGQWEEVTDAKGY